MSFNGSGTFVVNTAGQPVVPNTVISATAFNALTNDLANGLSTCITKDGQTTPTANIPMGSNKITGLAPGTSGTDAANLSQVQGSTAKLLQSVTGTDTITAAMVPALTAYAAGQMFYFVAAGDNTGAVTINIDSLGAKSVTRDGSVALVAGDILSGEIALVVYDGTRFQLLNGNSFTNLNVSNNLTLSAGTINGVAYLNGSKVLTSGSALTFDGTTLNASTGSPIIRATASTTGALYGFELNGGALDAFVKAQPSNAELRIASGRSVGWGGFTSFYIDTNESMRLTSTGLGIGTASPSEKLEVSGTVAGALTTRIVNLSSDSAAVTRLAMFTQGGTWNINAARTDFSLSFATGSTERMRLDSSGSLGLGVTPSAWISGSASLDIRSTSAFADVGGSTTIANNCYRDSGGGWVYKTTNYASRLETDTGVFRWFNAASGTAGNAISFTQALTLDASGNLLVGTSTSTFGRLEVVGGAGIRVNEDGAGTKVISIRSDFAGVDPAVFVNTNNALLFGTNNTERGRFTAGGDLLVGTTTAGAGAGFNTRLAVEASDRDPAIFKFTGAAGSGYPVIAWHSATTGDNFLVRFATEGTITTRGSITYNRAGGLVAYNTTSDYRAKDILGPVQNSGATIDALKVYEGQMKGASQSRPMLVAHEAQEHAPYAVTGEKDAVNEDGTPKYQQMDVSALVPLLLAEVQSLRSRVAALEAK